MIGPNLWWLISSLGGLSLIPINLLFILFPRLSTVSIVFGITFKLTSWSYLDRTNSMSSPVDIVINFDTSRMLLTEVPSIDSIISFFLKPADIAGLSIWTSSITAGVKSFPTDIYINKKIKIAKIKFANGPAATIIARW